MVTTPSARRRGACGTLHALTQLQLWLSTYTRHVKVWTPAVSERLPSGEVASVQPSLPCLRTTGGLLPVIIAISAETLLCSRLIPAVHATALDAERGAHEHRAGGRSAKSRDECAS